MKKIFYKDEPTSIIVDGPMSFIVGRVMQQKIDFARLKEFLRDKCQLRTCHYVTPLHLEEGSTQTNTIVPLIDWLSFNGWRVRARNIREKGTSLTDFTAALIDEIGKSRHVIILAGDADLTPVVAAVQQHGIRVTILNTVHTESQFVANSLRKQADDFVDLQDIFDLLEEEEDD